ncbi:MAG: signal peptide peptidase SppA [Candidatus Aminicenantales bacterium]
MNRGKYVLILFLIFFFLVLATIFSFIYFDLGRPPAVKPQSYLELRLQGELLDFFAPDFLTSLFMGTRPLSLHDLWLNIKKAKADDRIKAVLLRLNYLECDWAKIDELREAILDFRKSGKKAYAFIEEAPEFDKEYYLATACDRIILHPLGWLGINGIGGYFPFLRNALDKLGIEAEFEHVEEFKTAFNMFTESGFTEAHRKMMESIYGDIFDQYVKTVAESRKKSVDEVKALIDQAFFQGENALQAGLVDDLLFEDELTGLLQEKGKKWSKITMDTYSRIKPSSAGKYSGKKVALIYGMGPIHAGESYYQTMGAQTIARWFRRAREDRSIAAVVFRVDSPGGSAVASDVIWREVFLTKKEKPVVVSMSDMAGSGGYWVSMAAHKIVAHPQTLTGSIGVLSGKFNMARLYEKLGITAEKLSYGKKSDIFSTFRGFSPEEKELIKKEILWLYDRFLSKASEGRNMPKEDVDKIGKGRVWTGNQAKDLNLVDEIGGLSKAMELAKSLAGIAKDEGVRLVVWPKKTSFFKTVFGTRDAGLKLGVNPDLKKAMVTASYLEKEKIWAVMPFWLPF